MKKLGKILLLVLSLALVLGVFAVAASADNEPFYVDNLARATWEDAYANADENTSINLATDYTVSQTLAIEKSLTVNLGGKTLTASADVFEVTGSGVTVNIVGPGTIVTGGKALTVGEGATVNLSGDITVKSTATVATTVIPVSGTLSVSDKLEFITNSLETNWVKGIALSANSVLKLNEANLSITPDRPNASSVSSNYVNMLIDAATGTLVDAVDSTLSMMHGRLINVATASSELAPATLNFLRSTLTATDPIGTFSAAIILYAPGSYVDMNLTDSSVISGGRAIQGGEIDMSKATKVFVDWKNTNYSVPNDAKYGSPRLFCDGVSAVVDGGLFTMEYGSTKLSNITVRTKLWDGTEGILIKSGTRFTLVPTSEISVPVVDGENTYYYSTTEGSYNPNFSVEVIEGITCDFISETKVGADHELVSYYVLDYPRAEIVFPDSYTTSFEGAELGEEIIPSPISKGWGSRYGSGETQQSADGSNKYFAYIYEQAKYSSYQKKVTDGNLERAYIGLDFGPYQKNHPYPIYKYDYVTIDFDMASTVANEYGYASYEYFQMTLMQRDGGGVQYQKHNPQISIGGNNEENSACRLNIGSSYATLSSKVGEWNHVTYVIEIDNSTTTGADGVVYYNLANSKIHLYVDGSYVGTTTLYDTTKTFPATNVDNIGLDELRLQCAAISESTKDFGLAFDNVALAYYSEGYVGDIGKLVSDQEMSILECDDMVYSENYQYSSPNEPIANVDGTDYYNELGVINNIKKGSVVTLNADLVTPIPELEFMIKTNGHSFVNTSEDYYAYQEDEASDIWYVKYATNKVVIVWDPDDKFDLYAETEGTLNSVPTYPGEVEDIVDLANNKMQVFLGWSYENYGMTEADELLTVTQKDINDEEICLYPVFVEKNVAYTIKNELTGETAYYSEVPEDGTVMAAQLAEATKDKGSDVTFTLYADVHVHAWTAVEMAGTLSFDLNGHVFAFTNYGDAGNRQSLFNGDDTTWFNLYSSRAGGRLLNYTYYTAKGVISSSALLGGGNANFGEYVNEERGVNADGDNLTVHSTNLIDHYGAAASDSSLAKDQPWTTINIIGGTYKRTHSDSMGLLIVRKWIKITVKDATLIADSAPILATDPRNTAKAVVTIDNSYLYSAGNLFGHYVVGSSVTITNSFVDANINGSKSSYDYGNITDDAGRNEDSIKGTVIFGQGAMLAAGKTVDLVNFKIADDCFKVAFTDAQSYVYPNNTAVFDKQSDGSYLCNESSFVFTEKTVSVVPQFKIFADNGGEIANVEWYGVNGELLSTEKTIIGDNVKLIPDGSKLGVIELNNGWYDLGFTKYVDELGNDASEIVINEAKVYKFYPVMETPVADLDGIKYNLTTYSYFQYNIYIPTSTPENVTYKGTYGNATFTSPLASGGKVKIKGEEYNNYNSWPGVAHQRTTWVFVGYSVEIDGVSYDLTYSFGVSLNTYAEKVLSDDSMSLKAKTLVANMANYANETIKLLEGAYSTYWANAMTLAEPYITAADAYDELIASTPAGTATETLSEYITGASFLFGDYQPRFAFKYDSTPNAENGNSPSIDASKLILPGRNGSVTKSDTGIYLNVTYTGLFRGQNYAGYHYSYDKDGNSYTDKTFVTYDDANGYYDCYSMTNGISAYDADQVIKVAVVIDGKEVASGTYSLADYIKYQETVASSTTDEYTAEEIATAAQTVVAAKALYAFAMASEAYVSAN